MLNHSSAKQYEETAHTNKSTKTKRINLNGRGAQPEAIPHVNKSTKNKRHSNNCTSKTTLSNALKRRAQSLIRDKSIDAQSRAIIRYALEINDPWLPELVRRADAGETIIDNRGLLANTHDQRR